MLGLEPSLSILIKFSKIFLATLKSFPFIISVIIEAEAIDIAQPSPSNEISSTCFSSLSFKKT
jgi:hypothetical protein